MGIVAQGAAPRIHRAMDKGLSPPDLFTGMTGQADFLGPDCRKANPPRFDKLLVAGQALPVDRGTVLIGRLVDHILVTNDT